MYLFEVPKRHVVTMTSAALRLRLHNEYGD